MTNPTQALIEAARAVVERWDTPLWKDVEPTAHVINRLRAALLHQDEAQRREGACFECGAELHAPFCPACNPEMVRSSPSWPSKEEIADAIYQAGIGVKMPNSRNRFVNTDDAAEAILALFPAPTQDKTP